MAKTKINWANTVWNPVTGCTKVSAGCKNCYAERMAKRLAGRFGYPADNPFAVTLHSDRLDQPLKWRKPRRVFVNSMSDLFHEDVPDDFIESVFDIMFMSSDRHIFLILTKRPERMKRFMDADSADRRACLETAMDAGGGRRLIESRDWGNYNVDGWPNVWLGVSVEDQQTADERIPLLLQTPAAVRFVSYEPALEEVDFSKYLTHLVDTANPSVLEFYAGLRLDGVIMGGESGPGARPMHPDWAREVRDQCQAAEVPFFFKQWGDHRPTIEKRYSELAGWRYGQKKGGRLLDGRVHDELPGGEG